MAIPLILFRSPKDDVDISEYSHFGGCPFLSLYIRKGASATLQWQMHPFISKGTIHSHSDNISGHITYTVCRFWGIHMDSVMSCSTWEIIWSSGESRVYVPLHNLTLDSSFTNFAFMRKLPSLTNFALNPHVHVLIVMEIFHHMHGWKSPTRTVSDMNAMLACA